MVLNWGMLGEMKSRIFLFAGSMVVYIGISIIVFGVITFNEVNMAMNDYPSLSASPGSSASYPAFDQTGYYFGLSATVLALGGSLLIVQRRMKWKPNSN